MEKSLVRLTCIALLATASSVAIAQDESTDIKAGVAFDQGFGVTAQFNESVNAFIGNDGLSADKILRKGNFSSNIPINWYVGAGGAVNWNNDNEYSARVPLGATLPFAQNWNVYGQAAPNLAYKDKSNGSEFKFGADIAVGVRYAF